MGALASGLGTLWRRYSGGGSAGDAANAPSRVGGQARPGGAMRLNSGRAGASCGQHPGLEPGSLMEREVPDQVRDGGGGGGLSRCHPRVSGGPVCDLVRAAKGGSPPTRG